MPYASPIANILGLRWGPHKSCEALLIMHCERQALWRGVCPRRAERGALARAGMARAEMRQRARAGAGERESGRGGYMPFLAEAALPDKRDDAPPQAA